jgi:pimeloyl-ACP methyl ester carboxylesterase
VVAWKGRRLSLPYLRRVGSSAGPALLFVHGLGGSKENFSAAFDSGALKDCTLLTFDLPGSGLAEFPIDAGLDVSALSDLTQAVADALLAVPYFLVGASMGGLVTLLQIRRHGRGRVRGLINLEGNLCPEDCIFSRRVVRHSRDVFVKDVFPQMIAELRCSPHAGDRIIAADLSAKIDANGYHAYSFETVAESDSGKLLDEFLALDLPRLFLHGDANRGLSYLPRLRRGGVRVQEIPSSAHFFFHDNPSATFEAIGAFVHGEAPT